MPETAAPGDQELWPPRTPALTWQMHRHTQLKSKLMVMQEVKSKQRKQECPARRQGGPGEGLSADSGTKAERLSTQPETRLLASEALPRHVQPVAHSPHAAQENYEFIPTQIASLFKVV